MNEQIENITNLFFNNLGFNIKNITILKEKENIFFITLKIDKIKESSLIIWPHWKNLESIKRILKIIIIKTIWEDLTIHLEVNNYLYNKDSKLFSQVNRKIKLVKRIKQNTSLPFLSSYERKKVHSYIAKLSDDNIYTKSEWKWVERSLYICYKEKIKEKLSIDIDGNDI